MQFRQVPQQATWASSLWCSRDGVVWRRHYDVMRECWRWEDKPVELVLDEGGRLGVFLEWWTSLEIVVGLAWRHRAPDSASRVTLQAGKELHAKYVRWQEEEDPCEQGRIKGESWKPLKWRCGVVPCPNGYDISDEGRLRGPEGDVTIGFWYEPLQTRLAAVKDCGLVDLMVAARLKPRQALLSPSLKMAADCLLSGFGPRDLANAAGVTLETAWGYFTKVALHIRPSDLKCCVRAIVSRDLWSLLVAMLEDDNPALGGKLKDLMPEVEEMLSKRGEFRRSEHRWSELRLARMAIVA